MEQRRATVLVVDDEALVRDFACKLLERDGFTALEAGSAREGLALVRERSSEIRLVLLDLTMPIMSGEQFLQELRTFAPALPVIVQSGEADSQRRSSLAALDVTEILLKPYQPRQLRDLVRKVLL
jgi:CheY-like chemotaxis protein